MSNSGKHTGAHGAGTSAPTPGGSKPEVNEVSTEASKASKNATVVEEKTPLELLEDEVSVWKDRAARAQAEFANTRKRLEERQIDAMRFAAKNVVENIIPVIDDLEYARRHADETGNEMAEGITAIYAKLVAALIKEGVELIDPLDKPFDHNTATAVQMVENPEVPDQTVTAVMQRGYVLGGRVIRPAMVVVATGGSPAK
ncbi:MAG: nucleotide exchange factor GrpE [Coriobacteriia bacterium]|nr:nucleotide exchange factor GrpE [Coriobacteriia bacterium]